MIRGLMESVVIFGENPGALVSAGLLRIVSFRRSVSPPFVGEVSRSDGDTDVREPMFDDVPSLTPSTLLRFSRKACVRWSVSRCRAAWLGVT